MMGLGIWDKEGRKGKFVEVEEHELEMDDWEDGRRGDRDSMGAAGWRESFESERALVHM